MASTTIRRAALRTAFSNVYKGLLELFAQPDADLIAVSSHFKILENKFSELTNLNQQIETELFEKDPTNFEAVLLVEMKSRDEYELMYQTAKLNLEALTRPGPTNWSGAGCSDKKSHVKLPEIKLRPYNGEIGQWIAFWSQFSCIDGDDGLSEESKFQYLIQATLDGSRARALVNSFPPSGKNYSKAVLALKDRFGRSDLLIEHYVRALLRLVTNKQGMKLCELYDQLETQVRSLESLDIVSEQYAALLFPLVESCIPAETLKVWQRSNTDRTLSLKTQMDTLMRFLKAEVEAEERVSMANHQTPSKASSSYNSYNKRATAADLTSLSAKIFCVFCEGAHKATDCKKAKCMSLDEKRDILGRTRACFGCAMLNHPVRRCRAKCICGGRHIKLLCPKSEHGEGRKELSESQEASLLAVDHNLSVNENSEVFLQTFSALLYNEHKQRKVRVLIDSGSQRSYILNTLVKDLDFKPTGEEKLVHSLFGGANMGMVRHNKYKIRLRSVKNGWSCNFTALDQKNIAAFIPAVTPSQKIRLELKSRQIELLEDTSGPIDILIGADVAGKVWSGNRSILPSGMVAIETEFGWILMGVCKDQATFVNTGLATTYTMASIAADDEMDLWKLEAIGISDPIEKSSKEKCRIDAMEHFKRTVEFVDGHYRVRLPWNEMVTDLPTNRALAKKRFISTSKRLERNKDLFHEYDQVFKEWLKLGIIEEISDCDTGHFLPHRPVVKESSSTTKVRPVFDASARSPGKPSLNDCLESGPNMIELIPDLLLGFRKGRVGTSADIEKAFLQIEIHPEDRKFLKFLTMFQNNAGDVWRTVTMRHNRVVFGVTCSPFLLSAVLDYHLDRMIEKKPTEMSKWITLLKGSLYVDNLVCSVDSDAERREFQMVATKVMAEGGFNLRGWESTRDGRSNYITSLLGLKWDREKDTLSLNLDWWNGWNDSEALTKRNIYSMIQKIFDPVGFCSPVTVNLKRLIQTVWEKKIDWDDIVDEDTLTKFDGVLQDAHLLKDVAVQRCLGGIRNRTLHLFCDASAKAYAACIFLRSETSSGEVCLNLVQAKSKIVNANLRPTMPRLELMGVVIGVRLLKSVIGALKFEDVPSYGWSDSSTVLAWIQRQEEWSVFVRNRVKEIRELGSQIIWRHVPGNMNPADLPSRGCSIKQLSKLQWWEGPTWLKQESDWPHSHCTYVEEEGVGTYNEQNNFLFGLYKRP